MFKTSRRPRSYRDYEAARLDGSPPPKPGNVSWMSRRHIKAAIVALVVLTMIPLTLKLYSPQRVALVAEPEPEPAPAPEPELPQDNPITVQPEDDLSQQEMPPLYERFREHELQLSRLQGDPPDAKYFWTASFSRGWGNVMQELVLHAYLAYRTGRTFVWYNYTWNDDGSNFTLYNGKPIPSQIPLSALLGGPLVGGPFLTDPNGPQPASIAKDYFDEICPEGSRRTMMNNDVLSRIEGESTAAKMVEEWVQVLKGIDDKCVAIPRHSYPIFDIWMMGDGKRLLDIWPDFAASPIMREFRWSPLIELAFDVNRERVSPTAVFTPYLSTTGNASVPSAQRYTPLPGLLVLHVRRGDYEGHCRLLGQWSSPWIAWNSFDTIPGRFDRDRAPQDEEARQEVYRRHCYPDVEEIVARTEAMRVQEAEAGRGELRDVYVMTNGPVEWVDELKAGLRRTGHWRSVASSRDMVLNPEQKYVKQAVDMLIGQRAQVFVGNGWSSLSGIVTMLRMANGILPQQTQFF